MDVHEYIVAKSTPEELAQLLRDMSAGTERYREAFYAAKAFIEYLPGVPVPTREMVKLYEDYCVASKGL